MRDLVDIYAEARFGKAAASLQGVKDYLTMPQLDEKTLAIRNAIEESVRKEQQLKARAKTLTELARRRVATAPQAGFTGQASDIVRAIIPGLSPAAAADGIEKDSGLLSYTTPKAEKKYDTAHILAAGTGAGLGAARQRGMLSEHGSQRALRKLVGAARGAKIDVGGIPRISKRIAQAGTLRGMLGTLKSVLKLKGVPAAAAERSRILSQLGAAGKGPRLGGWKGALAGAALVSLPLAIRRWAVNRQMRARGGGAAAEAATTAEANIAAAKKLQEWRKQQLSQLEQAAGAEAPASDAAPGPFDRYKLTPYQQ